MADTAIEWTDKVWNPTTGCDRVSPGCDHCYALTMAKRLKGMGSAKYQNDGDPRTSGPGFLATEHGDALTEPLRWRKPRKVFVNSMSDLFHERVSDEFLAKVFAVMAATPQHTYQILTKRHARMRSFVSDVCRCGSGHAAGIHLRSAMSWAVSKANPDRIDWLGVTEGQVYYEAGWPLPNVWLGVSVESQQWADIRIPALLDTPAAVRWLSCEPLLGPVDLDPYLWEPEPIPDWECDLIGCERGTRVPSQLRWVVAGGESGPGARPMHPSWARSLRDQCTAAGVPFLFKQWGAWVGHTWPGASWHRQEPHAWVHQDSGAVMDWAAAEADGGPFQGMYRVGKNAAGRVLDGRTWDQFPESWARLSGEGDSSAGAPNQAGGGA